MKNRTDDITQFNGYVPEQLVAYLYDTLQSRKDYIMADGEIYIISIILQEQLLRKFKRPSRQRRAGALFMRNKN